MPITWKNINVNRGALDAALIMKTANQSVSDGFDKLAGVSTGIGRERQDAYKRVGAENTNPFLDALAGKSPEELQAMKESGQLESLKSSFNGNVDRNVARDGYGDALTKGRQSANAEYDFTLKQAKQEAAPLEQEFYKNLYSNTKEGDAAAQKIMSENTDLFGRAGLSSTLAKDFTTTNRAELEQQRSDTTYLEGRALKASNDTFDSLKSDALEKFSDAASVRRYMVEEGRKKGISPAVLDQRIGEADTSFENMHGLTTEQRIEHDAVAGAAQREADNANAQYNMQFQAQQSEYDGLKAFDASAAPPSSVGEVIKNAATMGFDKTNWTGPNLQNAITAKVDEFKAEFKDAGIPTGKLGAIAAEALARMGNPDEGAFDNNFRPEEFKANMLSVYQESQQRDLARNNLEAARVANLKRTQETQAGAAGIAAQSLAKYRGDNLAKTIR